MSSKSGIETIPYQTKLTATSLADFLLILVGGLLLAILVIIDAPQNVWFNGPFRLVVQIARILLGLIYVLYVPGYLLQTIFFPIASDLDSVERVGLSLGLSVVLIVMLAALFNWLPWGLKIISILIGQSVLILILIIPAVWLRTLQRINLSHRVHKKFNLILWWDTLVLNERRLFLLMSGSLIIGGLVAAWILLRPLPSQFITEFFILGKEGLAEDYPHQGVVGEWVPVQFGITNRETIGMDYIVRAYHDDQLIGQAGPFHLASGQHLASKLSFILLEQGKDVPIQLKLFRQKETEPYRSLLLRFNVEPAP